MATIHELYGIQAEALETLHGEYSRLLEVLRQVKSGELPPERVLIKDNGWKILPEKTDDDSKCS